MDDYNPWQAQIEEKQCRYLARPSLVQQRLLAIRKVASAVP